MEKNFINYEIKNNNCKLKKEIYSKLAKYAEEELINYSILNGYDPNNDDFGRDLDVHVPNYRNAIKMLFFFRELLKDKGIQWNITMNPVWGMRCIGVTKDFKNIEFHIFINVFVTIFPVSKLFKLNASKFGNQGLLIDPLFMLFKSILIKKNRKILKLEAIWKDDKPKLFLIQHKEYIGDRIGQKFTSLLLKEQLSINEMKTLRVLFIKFLSMSVKAPFLSLLQFFKSLYINKIKVLFSPCAPKFILNINKPVKIEVLKASIEREMGEVFKKVHLEHISNQTFSWPKIRYIQSTQTLYILISDSKHKRKYFHKDYDEIFMDTFNNYDKEIKKICNSILDETKAFNSKWDNKLTIDNLNISKDN